MTSSTLTEAGNINNICGTWWRHPMETFSVLLAICTGNSPVPGEFPAQRPVTRSFDVFFDLRLNKRLSKQSWGWWFETLSCPLWRHFYKKKPMSTWIYVSGHLKIIFKPGLWLVGMKIWGHYRKYLLNNTAITWNTFFVIRGPLKGTPCAT